MHTFTLTTSDGAQHPLPPNWRDAYLSLWDYPEGSRIYMHAHDRTTDETLHAEAWCSLKLGMEE